MAARIRIPGWHVDSRETVTRRLDNSRGINAKLRITLFVGVSLVANPFEWIGDLARSAYCNTSNYAQAVGAFVLRGETAGLLGANPCNPAPPPPSSPQFYNPQCNGSTSFLWTFVPSVAGVSGAPVNTGGDGRIVGTYITEEINGLGQRLQRLWRTAIDSVGNQNEGDVFLSGPLQQGQSLSFSTLSYRVTPGAGVTCGNQPGSNPPVPPSPETTPPEEVVPPPPASQQPMNVSFTFHVPIFLPGSVQVQIPVTAHINPTINISPTINIPFTLDLPDLNANFSFAFNPHFSLVDLSGNLPNWPPEGIQAEETLEPCPPVELPLDTREKVVGVRVFCNEARPPALTTVPSEISSQLDGIFPRYATVKFRNSRAVFSWGQSVLQVNTRYAYVPCPWPEGADAAIVEFAPGVTGSFSEHREWVPIWKEQVQQ